MLNKLLAATCLALSCSTVSASLIEASQDPDALYSIVSMSGDSSDRTVITQRVGISGTSYSARQFDCTKRTVRFLGSGISLDDLKSAVADKDATPIFKGSLARAISQEACGESLQPEAATAANSAMAAQN
ncbi:hypothetical protein EXN22_10300 [Pseudomonas tructae]|uniref:Uncharacterized protein n=1 Tax=Pseudomonas tructae TaxID=2518644 RepID=A0A411MGV6_9PSED|nr:hypothetical protein [Pseudomonas tructae]QBF26068.1 hypothetical protein EXN22_10300 [Pseudomonas tructae]